MVGVKYVCETADVVPEVNSENFFTCVDKMKLTRRTPWPRHLAAIKKILKKKAGD
jgi:hypothetical protein